MNGDNTQPDIGTLARASGEGDHTAFAVLFEHLHPRIFGYVYARTKHREDALDVTQKIFVDLWRALKTFRYRTDAEFYGFVFTITKRQIIRHRAARARADELPLSEHVPDQGTSGKTDRDAHEKSMIRAVETLPQKLADVIFLRHFGGLSFAEIADMLSISENTAKVRHHRATQKLQDLYDTYEA